RRKGRRAYRRTGTDRGRESRPGQIRRFGEGPDRRLQEIRTEASLSDIPPAIYRRRDLSLFVASRFTSTCAMQVQSVAIGWQIYDMVRTPLALGLVGLCQFVPMFLCTLPAGDMADRFNQRRVYGFAAILQAICSALFLVLTLTVPHTPWPFYAVLILFGA